MVASLFSLSFSLSSIENSTSSQTLLLCLPLVDLIRYKEKSKRQRENVSVYVSPLSVSASTSCADCQTGSGQTYWSDFPYFLSLFFFLLSHLINSLAMMFTCCSALDYSIVLELFLFSVLKSSHQDYILTQNPHDGPCSQEALLASSFSSLPPPLFFKRFQMLSLKLWNVPLHIPPPSVALCLPSFLQHHYIYMI